MRCRGCDDSDCLDCADRRAGPAAVKTRREVEQWKAVKLIADLANATLRQRRMEPSGLEDALFTIRRTAQLAVVIAADHKEHLKSRVATDALIEGCRQFIFDAFDKHGYDVHDDGCAEDDTCSCPRAIQANALLHGWVAK